MIASQIKGWCPGALRPMESGDGLIVRLKIAGGIVPLDLAARIADWSAHWGNGEIDLTGRANLQLRGVSGGSLSSLRVALAEQGLLDGTIGGEAVRNVISSPLAGLDPTALLDVRPLARALEDRLSADPALHALPAKFGFLIDDGGYLPLRDVHADVRFTAVERSVFAVGLDGRHDPIGYCSPGQLVETAAGIAREFLMNQGPNIRRMRDLVLPTASPLEGEVGNGLALPGGGAGAAIGLFDMRNQNPPPAAVAASTSPSRGEATGVLAYLGVGLPFGRTSAAGLTNLAACALETGATEMRLTPWRAILIPLPSAEDAQALAARLAGASLILDPADPRLRLAACSGAPSCPHGTTDTRADAAYLAPIVEHRSGIALHVSGCAKGCAHPRAAPVTLVGSRGRYDLVIGGKPSDSPSLTGLTLDAAAGHLRQMADRHAQGGTA